MQFTHVHSRSHEGLEAPSVTVAIRLTAGLPHFQIVGLGDSASRQVYGRVHSALPRRIDRVPSAGAKSTPTTARGRRDLGEPRGSPASLPRAVPASGRDEPMPLRSRWEPGVRMPLRAGYDQALPARRLWPVDGSHSFACHSQTAAP